MPKGIGIASFDVKTNEQKMNEFGDMYGNGATYIEFNKLDRLGSWELIFDYEEFKSAILKKMLRGD